MKKNLIALAVAAALIVPASAFAADNSSNDNTGPVVYGYAQITGSTQFGTGPASVVNSNGSSSNGLIFGANRVRLGFKGEATPSVTYNIMGAWDNVGFGGNSGSLGYGNGLNNGLGTNWNGSSAGNAQLLDAWINFAPVSLAQLEVGKFKTPEGLEYNAVKGNELPFIFRNMGQSLLPGRTAGAMLHADDVMGTGVSYAVGIFDNASLDGGTVFSGGNTFGGGQSGFLNGNGKYITSGMLSYSMSPLLTAEVSGSMGTVSNGLTNTSDNDVSWNVGVRGGLMGITYAAGYTRVNGGLNNGYLNLPGNTPFKGDNTGSGTINASDWHVGLGANLYKMGLLPLDVEPVVRYDQYSVNDITGHPRGFGNLANTTIGVNYYVNPNNAHAAEIQLNYIIPSHRGGAFGNGYGNAGYRGFTGYDAPMNGLAYDTLMLQFQAGF